MNTFLEFYFDFGSPTSYLAFTQIKDIAKENDQYQLIYKPVLLGGIFQATGNASPVTIPAKGAYVMKDLKRYAEKYQVPLVFNPYFPINTLALMRIAIGIQMHYPEYFLQYVGLIFDAIWVKGLNMSNPEIIQDTLKELGLEPSIVLNLQNDVEVKAHLKSETSKAVDKGIFGLPVIYVDEEMFWGQDRLDFVREILEKNKN